MNWFNNLTDIQKVILILIAGVVSITGLSNLSNTSQDYYVANAVSTAFFQAILLLVIASPFIYLIRKKEPKVKDGNEESGQVSVKSKEGIFNRKFNLVQGSLIIIFGLVALGVLVGFITFITYQPD